MNFMKKNRLAIGDSVTDFYFEGKLSELKTIADPGNTFILTDEHVFEALKSKLRGFKTIIIPPGEAVKQQETVNNIIGQLIESKADRKSTLVGIGGGVITDLAGYVASVYMRGIRFGFVPTSLLAMVDAAIGGKNGIDVGLYKNMVGVIRQPAFLLYDISLLKTLPHAEWVNGFAEIIKHACIKDAPLFKLLQQRNVAWYQRKKADLQALVQRNAKIKAKVVQADPFEQGERKLLNFGHTLGHAIENQYELPHGHAVAIGMVYAAHLSQQITGYKHTSQLIDLLEQYELPTHCAFNVDDAFEMLKMDKKREQDEMKFVLLNKTGQAIVQGIAVGELGRMLKEL